ncbi:MAG: cofactor-independent phosphoglycerate mutase [Bacteroidales bacterium]|nr:cofactor-independent phosphoglycerate mutase [Bacteroidales bacterium]
MKYLIVLGDGMADEAMESLGGRTPLQAASIPCMNSMAKAGCCGQLRTVPQGFPPGSEIANLSLLGYDVTKQFEGRGSLEAASMGIDIPAGFMAARCNLICVQDGKIKNHSAGHISSSEAGELIDFLNKELGSEDLVFHTGVSYRHLLLLKGGNKELICTPPHDVPGMAYTEVLPKAVNPMAEDTAQLLSELILRSQELLSAHPVNLARKAKGLDMANSIWPWSPGYRPAMQPLMEKYPIRSGSVISAVDLIKGIGVYAGLEPIEVPGATGLYDTNYEGKAQAAIDELKKKDFVFLHVEASDEASHEGDVELKIRTIEYLDQRLICRILEEISGWDEAVTIAVLPDHPTYCRTKTHATEAVPFLIYRSDAGSIQARPAKGPEKSFADNNSCAKSDKKAVQSPGSATVDQADSFFVPDAVQVFDEFSVQAGYYGTLQGEEFIRAFFGLK